MPPTTPAPPLAPRRPTTLTIHGHERVDEWFWLRDRDDPEVIAYLDAENAYCEAAMAHTTQLQEELFEEFRSRILETDLSVPYRKGDYWYYYRTVEGLQYPISCRRRGSPEADPEEVLLDQNVLAEGHEYFAVGAFAVSPDHRMVAYSTDTSGAESYTLRFRDLATGGDLPDQIEDTYYGVEWSADARTVFYTTLNDAKRPWRLWRHVLGTPASDDVIVYQEDDESFFLAVGKTRSEAFVVVHLHSMVTTEARVLEASDPLGTPRLIEPRRHNVEYSVEHHGDSFYLVTNDEAPNFKLVRAPVHSPGRASWEEVLAHRDDVKLDGVDAFRTHMALYERAGGVTRIRIMDLSSGDVHEVDQPEPVCFVRPSNNEEFDTPTLRFEYTSFLTPRSVFDYRMDTRERELKKQQPVLGDFDPDRYESARLWATAADGTSVPISVVHQRGLALDGTSPCLLYGYGSYESSTDPVFSSFRLSLLDRGFVFAIAHVRGGGEMGRLWYENGKFLSKRNTFTDFIACAEHLISQGYTAPDRLAARGGSAGGLLMGAVSNLRPDLFRAVVAEVPFVDVLTTILDETLPLTVIEWEEWGNPNDPEYYEYMRSYAPYDNVIATDYPAMLVTAGLNDPRVSYWEPAKWVAKLRATRTDDDLLLLKTEMGAGHGGPSGRYDAWRDEAFVYAFLLDQLGVAAQSV